MKKNRLSNFVLFCMGATLLAVGVRRGSAQILDETCSVTVNGRTAQVRADGSFSITGVPVAVDLFRVTGVCQGTGVPLYIVGDEFFEMATNGQTIGAGITLDSIAPPKVALISVSAGVNTLTMPGETTQLQVTAHYANGSMEDVTPRAEGTAYRTSNPAIATVSLEGLVTAVANGTALLTVSNQGATAVLAMTVSLGDPLTTVEGFVQLEDGTPVNGAMVTTTLGGSEMSGPDGGFTINGVASLQGSIVVEAEAMVGMTTLYGQSLELEPIKEGITDAGIVEIGNKVHWITNGSGNWSTGSNWHTGAPPTSGQIAVIDRPGMNIAVTVSSGSVTPGGIICAETISLTGGSLAPTGYSEINTLNLSGGTLGGAGETVVTNAFNWTGGTISGSGTTTVDFGAKGSISGTSAKTMTASRVLRNEGELTWTGAGNLFVSGGATLVNTFGAVFDVQNSASVTWSTTQGSISNAGMLRKTVATATSTISVPLNNSGTLSSQSGTISLTGGGTNTGLFASAAGTAINIDAATYNFGTGGDSNGPGFVGVSGGTLTVGVGLSANAENLSFTSGTINGTGTLNVRGILDWSGGTMTAAGTTNVTSTGSLNISGTSSKTLSASRQLVNNGTGNWTGTGNWFISGSSLFNNAATGVFDFQNNATITWSTTQGSVSNAGTLRKSVGITTSTIDVPVNNSGTLNAQSGTISLTGAGTNSGLFSCSSGASIDINASTYNFATGADTNGPGFVGVSGGTLSVGAGLNANADNLSFTSGTINGTGTLNVRGVLNWSGGTMTAAGVTNVTSTGLLNISGTSSKTLSASRQLINNGTGSWTGTGNWFISGSAVFNNAATAVFDFQTGATITWSTTQGSVSNGGVLRRTGAAGTTTVDIPVNNTGTLESQSGIISLTGAGTNTGLFSCFSGASIDINASTYNFGTGADTNGPGFVGVSGGTLSVGAGLNANADNLSFTSGTVNGTGTLNVRGMLNWSGGTMTAAGITNVTSTGSLNISGTSSKTLSASRQLVNNGTGSWTGTGNWFISGSSLFNNAASGAFDFQNNATITWSTTQGSISNAGLLRKTVATGTSAVDVPVTNTGTMNAQTGTINLTSGGMNSNLFSCSSGAAINIGAGTYTFATGADTNGPGFVGVTGGTLSVSGTANAEDLSISSGTLGGTGTITVRGILNWSGGTMTAAGVTTVSSTGTLNINGTSSKTLGASRQLINNGAGTWTGTGNWFVSGGALFNNAASGVFDIQNNATYSWVTTPGSISNAGTFGKSVATGTTTVDVPYSCAGILSAGSGVVHFTGGFTQTAGGETLLDGGAVSASSTMNFNGGTVSGSGSIFANVSNAATFDPGFSAGNLAITGTYTQTVAGDLDIEIGGLIAGTQFDRVTSTGAASLNGTLNISLINGFEPMEGDSFVIMTYGSRTGNFSIVNGTDAGNGLEFQVTTGPTSVTLEVIQP